MGKLIDKTLWFIVLILFVFGVRGISNTLLHISCGGENDGLHFFHILFALSPVFKYLFLRFKI